MPHRPVHIGLVGSGFIARGLTFALQSHPEVTLRCVLTRRDVRQCGEFPRQDLLTNSLEQLIDQSEMIVECSGDVVHATRVIDAALQAGLPVVTMDAEFHVTTGSYFVGKGMLTEAQGDQPGSLAAMAEDARAMGFRILVYGNRKGYYNPDPPRDQMEYWAAKQGLSVDQVTGFTDGTKVQIEQALVANGLGATIVQDGMLGLEADDLTKGGLALVEHAVRIGQPISDYVVAPKAPAGIFLVTEQDPRQQPYLEYLKLGPGPYYVLIHNYHLCHLEIPRTIKRVLGGGGVLLDNSARPTVSIGAIAKRALAPGQCIRRGIGSFELRGEALRIASDPAHVPIGLVSDAVVTRPIEPGQRLTMDDLELPDSLALQAWTQICQRAIEGDGHLASRRPHVRSEVSISAVNVDASVSERRLGTSTNPNVQMLREANVQTSTRPKSRSPRFGLLDVWTFGRFDVLPRHVKCAPMDHQGRGGTWSSA